MKKSDQLPRREANGYREYQLPSGVWVPSMTTVLGHTKSDRDKKVLEDWKERVGEEKANHITKMAGANGEEFHQLCEDYLNGLDITEWPSPLAKASFIQTRKHLDRIYPLILEAPLFSERLKIAGRVDCIGLWDGQIAIIDFKTSRKMKKTEWIRDYFLQGTGYSLMFAEMTGLLVTKVVIIMTSLGDTDSNVWEINTSDYLEDTIRRVKSWEPPKK
jgi:genome maintenance exonuclease 1